MPDTQPQETQEKENHFQLMLVAIFVLVMITLLVIAILFVAPDIEKDLNQKITEQLEKDGITASVSVSGRDITLSGSVNVADIEKAETLTADVCSIHFIDNQLIARNATDVAPATNTDDFVSLAALQQEPDTSSDPASISEDATPSSPQKMEQNSSEAYEKILSAMSRYHEKQANQSQDKTKEKQQGASDNKVSVDFDTSNIQFKPDSKILTTHAKKALKKLATQLKSSTKTIEITVYSTKSKLAFEQAKVIQSYLVEQGIKKKRLVVIGRNSEGQNTTITIVEKQTN